MPYDMFEDITWNRTAITKKSRCTDDTLEWKWIYSIKSINNDKFSLYIIEICV